ncbi:SsgA family sporulation/cell division regulator [Kitasatospora terrestris]|uniref:SsgA family sporulation/cell division regulator n=1 Tax=Kitasatospora terrestris TaxID=258051 RepID=A0ABP9DPS2_9ACTN
MRHQDMSDGRELPEHGVGRPAVLAARLAMELDGGHGLAFRLPVDVTYSAADPLVVELTFLLPGDAPVRWTVSRELLLDGISAPAGEGDIHVCPDGADPGLVRILLRAPGGEALLTTRVAALHEVLLRTDLLVPFGAEWSESDLDQELAHMLAAN